MTGFPVECAIRPTLFWMHLGYALLGVVAGRMPMTRNRFRFAFCGVLLFPLIVGSVRLAGPVWFSSTFSDWSNYTQPIQVAGIVCLFYSFRFVPLNSCMSCFFQWFSSLSFCIYLCHPLVQEILVGSGFTLPDSSFSGIPIYFFVTLVASLLMSLGLSRIPKAGDLFG